MPMRDAPMRHAIMPPRHHAATPRWRDGTMGGDGQINDVKRLNGWEIEQFQLEYRRTSFREGVWIVLNR